MHGPIGCSGVQARPKSLHSNGSVIAAQHVAALAALDLLGLGRRDRDALERVVVRVLVADRQAGAGDDADAAPLGVARLEDLVHARDRGLVALWPTPRL